MVETTKPKTFDTKELLKYFFLLTGAILLIVITIVIIKKSEVFKENIGVSIAIISIVCVTTIIIVIALRYKIKNKVVHYEDAQTLIKKIFRKLADQHYFIPGATFLPDGEVVNNPPVDMAFPAGKFHFFMRYWDSERNEFVNIYYNIADNTIYPMYGKCFNENKEIMKFEVIQFARVLEEGNLPENQITPNLVREVIQTRDKT